MSQKDRARFFVQESSKEMWHVETRANCEVMLCGKVIPTGAPYVRVQVRWGPRRCPDCWTELELKHTEL